MGKIHADTRLEADLMFWLKAEAKENGNTTSTEIRHCIISERFRRETRRQRLDWLKAGKNRAKKRESKKIPTA
jgi:hypothetical protein